MRTCVIGLGKLGAPLAAVLAGRGFPVTGVDLDEAVVNAVKAGRAPVAEPGLQALFDAHPIGATTDIAAAVRASDVSFVIVPTPSRADGTYSEAAVVAAMQAIGGALRGRDADHLVVVVSTLMPGAMDGPVRQALEAAAGRPVGLCYSPLFVALGRVVADLRAPDLVLIGESDAAAGERLAALLARLSDTPPPAIRRMGFVNAELTKMAVNGFITAKISYANMLSELCDGLPGADAAVVAEAVGCDRRIGPACMTPALGYGGPCFPRDNQALAAAARAAGTQAELAEAADAINRRQAGRIVTLAGRLAPAGAVAVLGLAYKAGAPVCEESPGIAIAIGLAEAGRRVLVSDPEALAPAMAALGDRAEAVANAGDAARRADLVVIATPWPVYGDLPTEALAGKAVIDPWRLPGLAARAGALQLHHLGLGHER